jgi:hypothetical protein
MGQQRNYSRELSERKGEGDTISNSAVSSENHPKTLGENKNPVMFKNQSRQRICF